MHLTLKQNRDENGIYMEQYRVQYRALVLVVLNLRFSLPHVYVVF